MVGAMLRHLRSLRSFKRDHGWIHTLLEEAENERMHLLTFLALKEPNFFFRAAVLGAQGAPPAPPHTPWIPHILHYTLVLNIKP